MAIHYYSRGDGWPIDLGQDVADALTDMCEDGLTEHTQLDVGEYDITPYNCVTHLFRHNLLVHDDGTATLRYFPLHEGAALVHDVSVGGPTLVIGPSVVAMPSDQQCNVILGRVEDDPYSRILRAVIYTP